MNAMESASDIARRILSLLQLRAFATSFDPPLGGAVNFSDYTGFYDPTPWDRESVVIPWAGGLAFLTASDDNPAQDLTRLKPLGGDHFRVIQGNGEERDIISFHRDGSGKVTHLSRFGQFTPFARSLD